MVVAVGADVLPLAGGQDEDGAPLREVLRGEELLRQDRGPAPDGIENALADADAARVLAEHAHERLQGELGRELRIRPGAVAVLGRPQSVRVLELELVARPHVIETGCFEALRRLDHLLDRRVARRERAERERVGIEPRHRQNRRWRRIASSSVVRGARIAPSPSGSPASGST